MIELQQLTKRFGDSEVVKGLTFDVAEGTVLGFLGPNGAGKSTTMKMLTGFLEPSAGGARIYGHDVVAERQSAQQLMVFFDTDQRDSLNDNGFPVAAAESVDRRFRAQGWLNRANAHPAPNPQSVRLLERAVAADPDWQPAQDALARHRALSKGP